mmetsp:Transcript_25220/g.39354  ORF Transcript_25220/g.39354 Transcript_25220/m.39354 type:complete len:135 (-) Transcript_25220:16-420(-)
MEEARKGKRKYSCPFPSKPEFEVPSPVEFHHPPESVSDLCKVPVQSLSLSKKKAHILRVYNALLIKCVGLKLKKEYLFALLEEDSGDMSEAQQTEIESCIDEVQSTIESYHETLQFCRHVMDVHSKVSSRKRKG